MNEMFAGGLALTAAGLVAYVVGIWTPFPGRSFSVTAVMVGMTLAAIGRALAAEGST